MGRSVQNAECPSCSNSPSSPAGTESVDRKSNRKGGRRTAPASSRASSGAGDGKQGEAAASSRASSRRAAGDGNGKRRDATAAMNNVSAPGLSAGPQKLSDTASPAAEPEPDSTRVSNLQKSSRSVQAEEQTVSLDAECNGKERNGAVNISFQSSNDEHRVKRATEAISHALDAFFAWCRLQFITFYRQKKPYMDALSAWLLVCSRKLQSSALCAWPPLRAFLMIVIGITLTLGLMWLDCTIRGVKSLVRLGSAALFLLVCCVALNLGILAGFIKLFVALILSLAVAFFLGYVPAAAVFGIFGSIVLWMYGSFWFTGGVVFVGGFLFIANRPRLAILVGLLYSTYSAKRVGGWLGLIICLNMAFISSNLMIYLVHSNISDSEGQSFSGRTQGRSNSTEESKKGKQSGFPDVPASADECPATEAASTSDKEPTAVDKEVERVLSCKDHYAVLGLSRFDDVDGAVLKRDYRKKAMLVHPDKNLGNTVAEEAFKRLQNAYEVLLDPLKKRSYDDELKKEVVLIALKRCQEEMLRNGRFGNPENLSTHQEDEGDVGSRRIVCKKCNSTHLWICTNRNKSHARWCQECQDYHQAKDGDGWIEQMGHSFFFGFFRKVDVPRAYACADSTIYEVSEWVKCQGMKCPANTHKPSFHVATAGMVKSQSRNPRASRGNYGDSFSFAHLNENMTEEEFIKWLENAMASGMFNDINNVPGNTGARADNHAKPSKKKRKGKNKW